MTSKLFFSIVSLLHISIFCLHNSQLISGYTHQRRSIPSHINLGANPNGQGASLQIRSADNGNIGEKKKTDLPINPFDEPNDDEFKQVLNSSGTLSEENHTEDTHHQKNIQSPDGRADAEEIEYMSKAANPIIDGIETTLKTYGHKIEKGLKTVLHKIDPTLWSTNENGSELENQGNQTEPRESENDEDSTPFRVWIPNSEDRNNGKIESGSDSNSRHMGGSSNPDSLQYRMSKGLSSGLRAVMEEFQQSMAKSILMKNDESSPEQNTKLASPKSNDKKSNRYPNVDNYPDNLPTHTKNAEPNPDTSAKNGPSEPKQSESSTDLWDKAINLASSIVDTATDGSQYHVPMLGSPQGSQYYPNDYSQYYQPYVPRYDPYSYYSRGPNAYRPANPIDQAAIDLAEGFADYTRGGRYFKRSEPTKTSSDTPIQEKITSSLTRTVRQMNQGVEGVQLAGTITQSALNLAEGILNRNPGKIAGSGVNLGTGIATTRVTPPLILHHPTIPLPIIPRLMKRSDQPDTVWRSSSALADSIANVAMKSPDNMENREVLDAIWQIWKAASNLAQTVTPNENPAAKSSVLGPKNNHNLKSNSPVTSSKFVATGLERNIDKPCSNAENDDEVGSHNPEDNKFLDYSPGRGILKSATDFASRITTLALNPESAASQTQNPSGAVWDPAIEMASKIVGQAMTLNAQSGQKQARSIGPAYTTSTSYIQPVVIPLGPFVGN